MSMPTTWTTGFTDAIKTGTWRAALPAYAERPSPCQAACPVNGEIARWIGQARAGDWHGAWTTLVEHNPFPAVAGRVCHQPCESACNRGAYDEPLAVASLERHVGDRALAAGWQFPAAPLGTDRVAVVGGGPSGLSAAYQLRRRGYAVTIYEAQPQLGGLLRDGIPPYRLPRDVLDAEIGRVVALGIELKTGIAIATSEQFAKLQSNYDAVYLAIGARAAKRLGALNYAAPWAMDGAAYLARANDGRAPALGPRVVVIGGGSAAMDVARSARRAGHDVQVLALESEAQLPAQREEVLAAREEGIVLFASAMLRSASAGPQGVRLRCSGVTFTPKPFLVKVKPGSEFELEADAVITAIGQDPHLAPLGALMHTDGGLLWTDAQGATSSEGVYAGGDVASLQRFVTQAIAMGKRAALQIDAWMSDRPAVRPMLSDTVALGAVNTAYHAHALRVCGSRAALDAGQAFAEAARCFSCGHCTLCDNCLQYCPDMAVRRTNGGYTIAEDYCKGCGLCVRECPTGAIAMVEEAK